MIDFYQGGNVSTRVTELIGLEHKITSRISRQKRFEFGDRDVAKYNRIINGLSSLPRDEYENYVSELEKEAMRVSEALDTIGRAEDTIDRYPDIFGAYSRPPPDSLFLGRLNETIAKLKERYQTHRRASQTDERALASF